MRARCCAQDVTLTPLRDFRCGFHFRDKVPARTNPRLDARKSPERAIHGGDTLRAGHGKKLPSDTG